MSTRVSQDAEFNVPPVAGTRRGLLGPAPAAPEGQLQGAEGGLRSLGKVRKQRSLWNNAWRQFRRHRLAMAGLVLIAIFVVACVVGSLVYPTSYEETDVILGSIGPTWDHPFGTDDLGRDLMARVLWGGRVSLGVGLVAAAVAIVLGTAIGAISGFFGGATDSFLMRFTDMFISLPQLPLLLMISFLFKESFADYFEDQFGNRTIGIFILIVVVIGALSWMPTARLVRASFLSMKEKEFVEAAESIGATRNSLIFKHILPNVMSPIIVAATLGVGAAIITESTLSFLGLGFPSDIPTWGAMLQDVRNRIDISPHEAIFPGMAVFLTVLSINYIGDGLRDALDPRKTG